MTDQDLATCADAVLAQAEHAIADARRLLASKELDLAAVRMADVADRLRIAAEYLGPGGKLVAPEEARDP